MPDKRQKASIFLSHTSVDKPLVRKLASDLRHAGARVWLDEAEIKLGDSLIEKIEQGIDASAYLAVVLSPEAVNSNWVKQELRSLLKDQIDSGTVRVLPLLLRDCVVPPFLRDKLYADFRPGRSYRTALLLLLRRLGLSYSQLKASKLRQRFNPLHLAEQSILALESSSDRKLYAQALQMSLGPATFANEPMVSIPNLIATQLGITPKVQTKHFLTLGKAHSYKFLRSLGIPWQKTKGFKRSSFVKRYVAHFGRQPYRGKKGESPFAYSYGELLEWFEIPIELQIPDSVSKILLDSP